MGDLYHVRERLCEEIEEISKHTPWTPSDLERLKMLTASLHYVDESLEIEEERNNGFDEGYSGRRRNARGQYSRDYSGRMYPQPWSGNYSYDGNMDANRMQQQIDEMERQLHQMKTSSMNR